MFNKIKSQAALEFLTTYIWAFGVLLVLIGTLIYFGVLSPSKFLPQRCSFGAEIGCSDYTIASNGVQMRLKNNLGQPIIVDSITASNEKTPLSCTSPIINDVWPAGSVKDVPVVCDFTGAGIVEGSKEKLDLKISYHRSGSTSAFSKEVQGEVLAVAKGGSSGGGVISLGLSCKDIHTIYPSAGSGTYTIDPDGSIGPNAPFQVYCDMTTDGGGWTMLMKATRGTTFNYDAIYWTTVNTLNENDVTQNDGDAKYRSFNELRISDIMARWPDAGNIIWLENSAWAPMAPRTALQGFNEYRNWGIPQEGANWNPSYFSAQAKQCNAGPGRYGTKLKSIGGYNAGARWGYRFNENSCGDWNSDDAGGGIGLWTDRDSSWRYSAGDWSNCCRSSTGMLRSARVEIYGR